MEKLVLSSRNFNLLKFRQPFNLWSKGLDQIDKRPRRPSPFGKKGCPKGDSARAKRVPIWVNEKDEIVGYETKELSPRFKIGLRKILKNGEKFKKLS